MQISTSVGVVQYIRVSLRSIMTPNLCEVTSDRKTAGVRLSSLPACRRSFRSRVTLREVVDEFAERCYRILPLVTLGHLGLSRPRQLGGLVA
jgi:hypothetical protein